MYIFAAMFALLVNDGFTSRTGEIKEAESRLNGFYTIALQEDRLINGKPDSFEFMSKPERREFFYTAGVFEKKRPVAKIDWKPVLTEKPKEHFDSRIFRLGAPCETVDFVLDESSLNLMDRRLANEFFLADLNRPLLPVEELLLARWTIDRLCSESKQLNRIQVRRPVRDSFRGNGMVVDIDIVNSRPTDPHVDLVWNGKGFELCYFAQKTVGIVCRRNPQTAVYLSHRVKLQRAFMPGKMTLSTGQVSQSKPVTLTVHRGAGQITLNNDLMTLVNPY